MVASAFFTCQQLYAQNQVLTKVNGGTSWHGVAGDANIKAKQTTNLTSPAHPNSEIIVPFQSEEYDASNNFDPITGVFTPTEEGYYYIIASVNWRNSSTAVFRRSIELVQNGVTVVERNFEDNAGNSHLSICALVHNSGGDDFRIRVSHNSNSSQTISGSSNAGESTFTAFGLTDFDRDILKKKNGGATWESGTNMNTKIRAWGSNALTLPTGFSTIGFSTENYDVKNNFNHVSGVFTPPEAGYYVISADLIWSNISGSASIQLLKNGSTASVYEQNTDFRSGGLLHSTLNSVIYSDGTDNYRIGVWHNMSPSTVIIDREFSAFRINGPSDLILTKLGGGASWSSEISCVKAKRTSNMTIPSSTNTSITYSSEDFDANNEFDQSTGMFKPNMTGYYVIMATANWDNFNGNVGNRGIQLMKKIGGGSGVPQKINRQRGSNIMTSKLHTVVYYDGTPNTSYYMQAFQDSGSNHDIGGTPSSPGCTFIAYKL